MISVYRPLTYILDLENSYQAIKPWHLCKMTDWIKDNTSTQMCANMNNMSRHEKKNNIYDCAWPNKCANIKNACAHLEWKSN